MLSCLRIVLMILFIRLSVILGKQFIISLSISNFPKWAISLLPLWKKVIVNQAVDSNSIYYLIVFKPSFNLPKTWKVEWGPKIHFTRLYSIEAILERVIVFRYVSDVFPVNYYHCNGIICVSDWVFTTGDDIITFYMMCHRHDNTIFSRQCDVRHCKDYIHATFKKQSQYLETCPDNSLKIRWMRKLFKLWIKVKPKTF